MKKKRAMAVAITHFTASDTMELNVLMVESSADLTHFTESIYKMLSLTTFPHSKIPNPHKILIMPSLCSAQGDETDIAAARENIAAS